ncbi:MAG TPA: hypothetical protein VIJ53_03595, partial [Acidobacteriaceae bacterium]
LFPERYADWGDFVPFFAKKLAAAVCGSGLIGWLDPFSVLVRSIGLSILPGLNYAANATVSWLEHSSFGVVQLAGRGLHAVLAATILNFRQPHFSSGHSAGTDFPVSAGAQLAGDALLVPCNLSAGSAAGSSLALVDSGTA